MSYEDPIDTTGYGYEEWIEFAFDHPVSDPEWYLTDEMHFECEPRVVLGYYTRLFRDPRAMLAPYDDARIEQGIWFAVNNQLAEWIWDEALPARLRVECIAAMPTMFREFLADHPLDSASLMWWDMLRDFGEGSDPDIVEAMARALEEVLQIPKRHCRMSALHGLGHLSHPSKESIIRRFLDSTPDLDDELSAYAEQAMAGTLV